MGSSDLRDSFNAVANPAYTATLALLDYGMVHGTEMQILLFRGNAADGTPFEIRSDPIRGGADVNAEAKIVAQRLLDKGKPPS